MYEQKSINVKPETHKMLMAIKDFEMQKLERNVTNDEIIHDILVEKLIKMSRVSIYSINKKRVRRKLKNKKGSRIKRKKGEIVSEEE